MAVWETINVIVEEFWRGCGLTDVQRQDRTEYVNCKNDIHPGFGALSIAAQLVMNHICDGQASSAADANL